MKRLFHPRQWFHPLTRKRLKRFREFRRAYVSFWILLALYGVSLVSEFIANDKPLVVRFNGHWYVPVLRYYTDNEFTGSGQQTPPNYKAISRSAAFKTNPSNRMWWPPIPSGPYEILRAADMPSPETAFATIDPVPRVAALQIAADGTVVDRWGEVEYFSGGRPVPTDTKAGDAWKWPAAVEDAIRKRLANQPQGAVMEELGGTNAHRCTVGLAPFQKREAAPDSVRLMFRETLDSEHTRHEISVSRDGKVTSSGDEFWSSLDGAVRSQLVARASTRYTKAVDRFEFQWHGATYSTEFKYDDFRCPYRPVAGHWMGLDDSGRDVLVRILYGMRTSISFGLLLVITSLFLGIVVGAAQGFYGGWVDLTGQRLIEIWQAMPFLYIIILAGSIYGRSLWLLFVIYAIFNWIGISYYMRAEFLRLRHLPFVESARVMALPTRRILFRHILPNALVPIITFFPFELVGAIGTLTALDYLGFGLPPPTPSWGDLLKQALTYNKAWWLVLYPSLALFAVMLLCVFIGEGVRAAFDPRRYSRME